MSWGGLTGGDSPELRDSAVETRRFGLSCARLEVPTDAPGTPDDLLGQVTDALVNSDADLVVLRHPSAYVGWFAALRATGRDLIQADTLLYWRLRVGAGRRRPRDEALRVDLDPELDRAAVERFVGQVFVDYDNHYAADPMLDADLALTGYRDWAQRSAASGGAVAVRTGDGDLVALATTSSNDDVTEIELAGVLPAHRRRGVYALLVAGCEDLAAAQGSELLVISTQAHNTSVQRAWARYGFEPVAAFSTVHALRPGLLAPAP